MVIFHFPFVNYKTEAFYFIYAFKLYTFKLSTAKEQTAKLYWNYTHNKENILQIWILDCNSSSKA